MTALILFARKAQGLSWEGIAQRISMSPVFRHSACMGMNAIPFDKAQALVTALACPPMRPTCCPPTKIWSQAVPTDPCLYRLYEIVGVYGPTIKALIEEEFGTGIMSAIDFEMSVTRETNPKGDRVKREMSGKYLAYNAW
ncbi:cyanase [Paracoccus sp. 228]|uniref:cyanase n=1 Tax=Paracoccus sp. 228 TaxID=1192054 RepID=UPI000A74CEEB|nr:cyanase [Paracoccus sp. 228]